MEDFERGCSGSVWESQGRLLYKVLDGYQSVRNAGVENSETI